VPTEDLTNAGWTKAGQSSISGTIQLGSVTLNDFVESAGSAVRSVSRTVTITAGQTLNVSIHLKNRSSNRFLRIQVTSDGAANGYRWLFNPTTGATALAAGSLGTGSVGTPVIEAVSDGYRISLSGTVAAAATSVSIQFLLQDQAATYTATYTGDGTSGLYLGALQYSIGATLYPYQKVVAPDNITQSGIPDLYLPYFNGSQWMTAGTGTFGTASLFADASQAWTVWGVFRTLGGAGQTLIAKAGVTAGNRTLQVLTDAGGSLDVFVRGSSSPSITTVVNDGNFHVWALRWTGAVFQFWLDSAAAATGTPGAAVEEVQNITMGARTESSPAQIFTGHNAAAMVDYALSDAQMTQLMASLNSTYRQGL
jgi:hypothetical protein